MSWIKLDDQWLDHPKIILAGRDARDMWLASITWCAKHLTDGKFSANLLPSLAVSAGADVANCQGFAKVLLDVGLWDATPDGYMVHDYLDYNPSKADALATREARKQAGSAGGKAKASKTPSKLLANSWQNSTPSPSPSPYPTIPDIGNDNNKVEETPPTDIFNVIQRELETNGILVNNPAAIKAVDEIIKSGATIEDIRNGITWKRDNLDGGKFIYPAALVGPVKVEIQKRLKLNGNGNGNHAGMTLYTGPNGEEMWQ